MGGYQRPSEASHQPGPCEVSLMRNAHQLIVRFEDFDRHRVRLEIERFLDCIDEEPWTNVAVKIKEWFPDWEYDGYNPKSGSYVSPSPAQRQLSRGKHLRHEPVKVRVKLFSRG